MASIKRIRASDETANASQATVTQIRAALATTIRVDTVTGLYAGAEGFYATMGTPHTFTDPITSETITVISEASAVDFRGHIDTGNIIIDAIAPGYTDAGSKVGDIVVLRPTTQWADNVSDTLAVVHNDDGTLKSGFLFAGQGQMVNGVITPSVASNNLTLAIKTLAGNDPSATDPVYVRIGNTIQKITAALTMTLAAGTNWFNSGSAQFASQEIDYFVYLGYNATDGVTLGMSRIPSARFYSDFTTTSTDEKYAKISTIAHAASTDIYENIGRFNGILGASSTYNWSAPSTSIVVNRPINMTRWLNYATTLTNVTVGNGTLVGRYRIEDTKIDVRGNFTFGSTSSITGVLSIGLPLSCKSDYVTGVDDVVGVGGALDATIALYPLYCTLASTSALHLIVVTTSAGTNPVFNTISSNRYVSNTTPISFGTADDFTWQASYQAA